MCQLLSTVALGSVRYSQWCRQRYSYFKHCLFLLTISNASQGTACRGPHDIWGTSRSRNPKLKLYLNWRPITSKLSQQLLTSLKCMTDKIFSCLTYFIIEWKWHYSSPGAFRFPSCTSWAPRHLDPEFCALQSGSMTCIPTEQQMQQMTEPNSRNFGHWRKVYNNSDSRKKAQQTDVAKTPAFLSSFLWNGPEQVDRLRYSNTLVA